MNAIRTAFLNANQREKDIFLVYTRPHCISNPLPHLHKSGGNSSLLSRAVHGPALLLRGSLYSFSFYSFAQHTIILKRSSVCTSCAGSSVHLCCVIRAESWEKKKKSHKCDTNVNCRVNTVLWTFQDRNSVFVMCLYCVEPNVEAFWPALIIVDSNLSEVLILLLADC